MVVSTIFVAAGSSTRMGKANKLLLNYKTSTIVEHTFNQLIKSSINKIVVITGFDASKIKAVLNPKEIHFAYNKNYASGLTSSIQTGIKAISKKVEGYMITLADMPYLTHDDYDLLLDAFRTNYNGEPLIIVPKVNERSGNPVIFSKEFKKEILSHQKPEGCKGIIKKNNKFVMNVLLNNQNAFDDIDRPEDYLKLIDVRIKPDN